MRASRPALAAMLAAVLTLGWSGAALAQAATTTTTTTKSGGGNDTPIQINSDKLVLEQEKQLATFTGNVDAVQGDTTLRSDVLRVFYLSDAERKANPNGQRVKRLEADGHVLVTQPGETAQGDAGVYDLASNKMVLTGNVVLTQGTSVVKGDRLDVDRNTGVSVVSVTKPAEGGTAKPGRVRALFAPEPAAPAKPATQP